MPLTVYPDTALPAEITAALTTLSHNEWCLMRDATPPPDSDPTAIQTVIAPDAATQARYRKALLQLAARTIGDLHALRYRWLTDWHADPAISALRLAWHPRVVPHLPAITRHPLIRSRYAVALRDLLQPHRDNGTDTVTLPVDTLAEALQTPEHYGHDFTRLRVNALQPAVDGLQTALNWPLHWRTHRIDPQRPRAVSHVEFHMPDIREGHGQPADIEQHPLL